MAILVKGLILFQTLFGDELAWRSTFSMCRTFYHFLCIKIPKILENIFSKASHFHKVFILSLFKILDASNLYCFHQLRFVRSHYIRQTSRLPAGSIRSQTRRICGAAQMRCMEEGFKKIEICRSRLDLIDYLIIIVDWFQSVFFLWFSPK